MRSPVITPILVLGMLGCSPSAALADWLLTPYVGLTWGAAATFRDIAGDFDDEFAPRLNVGASMTWTRGGALGIEMDFGVAPGFFDDAVDDEDFEFGSSRVTTLMANLKFTAGSGRIRPYAVGGLGLIRSDVTDPDDLFEVGSNDWGFDAGGGAVVFFSDGVGVQGDVRYFRSLQQNAPADELDLALGALSFWRGTVGVVIRF
jgi:hypothetical protein